MRMRDAALHLGRQHHHMALDTCLGLESLAEAHLWWQKILR